MGGEREIRKLYWSGAAERSQQYGKQEQAHNHVREETQQAMVGSDRLELRPTDDSYYAPGAAHSSKLGGPRS